VLGADVMPGSIDATLQERPDRLNTVGVDRVAAVFASRVSHGVMAIEEAIQPGVASRFIRHDLRTDLDILQNRSLQAFLVCVLNREGQRPTAALSQADYSRLADSATAHPELARFVLIGFLATYKALIHFDQTPELIHLFGASLAQPLEHKPSCLLGHSDLLGKLHGTDSLPRRDYEVHGVDPLVERYMRPLKDSAGAHRESGFAAVATVEITLAVSNALLPRACRTGNAVGPKSRFQIKPCGFRIRDQGKQLERADCTLAHDLKMPEFLTEVKYISPLKLVDEERIELSTSELSVLCSKPVELFVRKWSYESELTRQLYLTEVLCFPLHYHSMVPDQGLEPRSATV
jgi:hypothetical protein